MAVNNLFWLTGITKANTKQQASLRGTSSSGSSSRAIGISQAPSCEGTLPTAAPYSGQVEVELDGTGSALSTAKDGSRAASHYQDPIRWAGGAILYSLLPAPNKIPLEVRSASLK